VIRSNWTVQAGLQARRGLKDLERQVHLHGLFFHTQVPAVLAADWVGRYPTVISLDATPMQYDQLGEAYRHKTGPAWLESVKTRLNRNCFQSARHLITWSRWAKDGLVQNYDVGAEKITVISPGVDVGAWERPPGMARDPNVIKILFVGADLSRKGGEDLLRAFQCLNEARMKESHGARLELHLVTQTPLEARPNVYLHQNMQPNSLALKELFYNADIFCLPTYGDCLPLALAEAGAASLPLISTQVGAIPELVQEEVNGFLIGSGNIRQLVETLEKLVDNPQLRVKMGEHSRRIVVEGHSAEKNSRQLIDLMISSFENNAAPGGGHA
jgi:glycosyltransferase involved in cell wall biosynthesis